MIFDVIAILVVAGVIALAFYFRNDVEASESAYDYYLGQQFVRQQRRD